MRTPWLIFIWFLCMMLLAGWLFLMRYYWKKAQEQQQVLTNVEGVRHFVLEALQSSQPKQWKGTEMLEYVVPNQPFEIDEKILRKRIWPRVCFDVRGNLDVGKSVIVSGGDLVDLWVWEPRQEQPTAQETGGDS